MKVLIIPREDESEKDAQWLVDELYEKIVTEEVDVSIEHDPVSVAAEVAGRLSRRRHNDMSDADILKYCEEAEKQFINAPIRVFVPVLVENIVSRRISGRGEEVKTGEEHHGIV